MKRQRNVVGGCDANVNVAMQATKKKSEIKRVVDHEKVEVEDEMSNIIVNGGERETTSCGLVKMESYLLLGYEQEWPWLRGAVDEQMSWGSIWLPFWDVEFMSEACSNALFSDVVGDYDIWNLKNVREIPQ